MPASESQSKLRIRSWFCSGQSEAGSIPHRGGSTRTAYRFCRPATSLAASCPPWDSPTPLLSLQPSTIARFPTARYPAQPAYPHEELGGYTIQPSYTNGSIVEPWNPELKNGILLSPCTCASENNPGQHDSKLVFQVSDGRYFLWQIWTAGYDEGRQLAIKHLRTQEANVAPARTVVVAAAIGKG